MHYKQFIYEQINNTPIGYAWEMMEYDMSQYDWNGLHTIPRELYTGKILNKFFHKFIFLRPSIPCIGQIISHRKKWNEFWECSFLDSRGTVGTTEENEWKKNENK